MKILPPWFKISLLEPFSHKLCFIRGGTDPLPGPDEDLGTLTLVRLKELCKAAGLPVTGRKADLIAALEAHRER